MKLYKRFDVICRWTHTTSGIEEDYEKRFKDIKDPSDVIHSIRKVPAVRCDIYTYFYTLFGSMCPFHISLTLTTEQLNEIYEGKSLPLYISVLEKQKCAYL